MIRGVLDQIQIERTSLTESSPMGSIQTLYTNRKFSPADLETMEEQLFDESTESENTVIHYEENKFRYNDGVDLDLTSPISQRQASNDSIKYSKTLLNNILDEYTKGLKDYRDQVRQEVQSLFEECQFDIISNYMSSSTKIESQRHFDEVVDSKILLQLSRTPYPLLLHSLRPQLTAASLLCFLRKHFTQITHKNLIKLIILSTTILNMSNNSLLGMKFYAQMMINRTKRIISQLLRLEEYFSGCSYNINYQLNRRSIKQNKNSKLNLVNSSMHFLISMIVNRIGRIVSFGLNTSTLQKYITIYGLDDETEEIKVVRNIAKNTSSCACTWYNEPTRILRTLKYTRKVLICTLMSSMEIENDIRTEPGLEDAGLFLRRFWNRLGIEEPIRNGPDVMLSTRILGIANELKDISIFFTKMDTEIVDEKLLDSFDFTIEEDLEVVNEGNEDDRVHEMSQMIERLAMKLDLIELGKTNLTIGDLKDDVYDFLSYYNDVTSGKNSNNERKDNSNLRRLRMSEILFDDENNKSNKQKRRSSGMNFPIVSVVKHEESLVAEADKSNTENEEFQRVLEKLCSNTGDTSHS